METTIKYVVHCRGYRYNPIGKIGSTKTFRKLDSAKKELDMWRRAYRREFEENGMRYYDGSGPITKEDLLRQLDTFFYIEKQTIESERLDY